MRQTTQLLSSPDRYVFVGDRESDIFELFCLAKELKTHFLVRTCVDRLAVDGETTIEKEIVKGRVRGLHQIEFQNSDGKSDSALLEIKFQRVLVLPPIGKQSKYPALELTVIHATEKNQPDHRDKICWKLLTDMKVKDKQAAIEKLHWYAQRWKIETFHKILKSGCRAEEAKLIERSIS